MAFLESVLIFVLQFEASVSGVTYERLYHRLGEDVVLSCFCFRSRDPRASVSWGYRTCQDTRHVDVVKNGRVVESSARAARLSVNSEASLIVKKVTTQDVGVYTCRCEASTGLHHVELNILTISVFQPGVDPTSDETEFECSLKQTDLGPGPESFIRWLDETGAVLLERGVTRETGCDAALTVSRHGNDRSFTCQFVVEGRVKTEAHYTPGSTGCSHWSPLSCILLTLLVIELIITTGILGLVIRTEGRNKQLRDVRVLSVVEDDAVNLDNVGDRPADRSADRPADRSVDCSADPTQN